MHSWYCNLVSWPIGKDGVPHEWLLRMPLVRRFFHWLGRFDPGCR